MPESPCVLFVDDEPHLLAGLRRGLHASGIGWQMRFAESGSQALELMAEGECDALITDMRMPGMDGARLLAEVQQRHPGVVRIVLSGEAERGSVLTAAPSAHQFLAKPCDIDTVVAVVNRALAVRRTLTDPSLRELIGGIGHLPSLPAVYEELTTAMDRLDCTVETVAGILTKDVATCVELLKLTNSAFFGIPRHIETVAQAVSMLGLDTIQALVVTGAAFRADQDAPGLRPADIERRALLRAAMTRRIGIAEGWSVPDTRTVALTALLLDVGALVLARGRPDEFARFTATLDDDPSLRADPVRSAAAEREHYGCSTTEASAYLLGLWGFSERLVHLVAGQPAVGPGANTTELVVTLVSGRVLGTGTPEYLRDGGVDPEQLHQWNKICDEVLAAGEADLEPAL
jgi:HD-like signal output (HDOD) protein